LCFSRFRCRLAAARRRRPRGKANPILGADPLPPDTMERFTISIDDDLAHEFDRLIERRGYSNRSEAVRDILVPTRPAARGERRAGALRRESLVRLQPPRARPGRAADPAAARAPRPDGVTMHAHLDHEHCIESVILRARRASSPLRRCDDRRAGSPPRPVEPGDRGT